MTRKPNFAKFMLGVVVLALLFIGTWAATRAPLTSTKKSDASTTASAIPKMMPRLPGALSPQTGTDDVRNVIELDGNIIDASPGPTPDDWDTINCGGGGNADKTSGVIEDGTDATIFTGGGSKDNIDIPGWNWKDGSTPPKTDLINGYAAKYLGPTGDTIFAFGAERSSNNGTSFIGVWFFQNSVSRDADGTFNGVHAVGDILVLNTFVQGGSIFIPKVYVWVGEGGTCAADDILQKGGTLCELTNAAPASVFSISNGEPITIPPATYPSCSWAYPGGTVDTNAFFEGAINIDAFPQLAGSCYSSFLIETRASAVVDAVLKDFILGALNSCECSVDPATQAVCAGGTAHFCAIDPAGGSTPFTYSWTGPDGTTVISTDQCSGDVSLPGTYTVTITDANGVELSTCQGTLTLNPSPTASVTVDESCADSITLTASGGGVGGLYAWDGAAFSSTATHVVTSGPTSHTVVVKNAAGCEASKTVNVGLCCRDCD